MQISFNKNIETEHKTEILKYLNPALWIVPKWCQKIHINLWDGNEPQNGQTISVIVNYDYRNAELHFNCCWLNQSAEDKQEQIVHELLHISLAILADYARDSIDNLCPTSQAEKFNNSIQTELRARHEQATQDLAFVIYNKFYEEKAKQI